MYLTGHLFCTVLMFRGVQITTQTSGGLDCHYFGKNLMRILPLKLYDYGYAIILLVTFQQKPFDMILHVLLIKYKVNASYCVEVLLW